MRSASADWAPLFLLPVATLAARGALAPWAFMWLLAGALFAGFKWLTGRRTETPRHRAGFLRSLGYLVAWPGMDAVSFLSTGSRVARPTAAAWREPALKVVLGCLLLWGIVPWIPADLPRVRGWAGLAGLGFLLHFGGFHLLSLGWRSAGVNARPIMRAPLLAKSVGDFWSRRWNLAFHDLVLDLVCRPLKGHVRSSMLVLCAFAVSGLLHECVISLPAGGGFGLPLLYFLAQGMGVNAERSRWGVRIGLGRGGRGRMFAVALVSLPAYGLFHPLFLDRVLLPFLDVLGTS